MPPLAPILSLLWSILTSRVGQICMAALIAGGTGYFKGYEHADASWKAEVAQRESAAKQAQADELARELDAHKKIAAAANERADEQAAISAELKRQIDLMAQSEEANDQPPPAGAPAAPCISRVDPDFAGRVRDLDAAGNRAAKPTRSAR